MKSTKKHTIVVRAQIDMVVTFDVDSYGNHSPIEAMTQARKRHFIKNIEFTDEVKVHRNLENVEGEHWNLDYGDRRYWQSYGQGCRRRIGIEEPPIHYYDFPEEIEDQDLVLLNKIDEDALLKIPGFGKKLVSRILEQREEYGEWRRWREVDVQGFTHNKIMLFCKWYGEGEKR